MSFTKEYHSWMGMKKRCYGNDPRYSTYRDKGITICQEWLEDFANFYADMGNAPTSKHTIDRKDNSKGYYKENCRWATSKEQNRNYSLNRLVTFNGKTQCVTEWAEETGISRHLIYHRLDKGWPIERVFSPVRGQRDPKTEYVRKVHCTNRSRASPQP